MQDYKKNENKRVEVDDMQGAAQARESVVRAARYYEREYVPKAEHVFDHTGAEPRQGDGGGVTDVAMSPELEAKEPGEQ